MAITLQSATNKLKPKISAAKASVDNVVKLANVTLNPAMAPGALAESQQALNKLKARAQTIQKLLKDYDAAFAKFLAKVPK
jgi:hypothetical protein